jgi:hypothetical protein
MGSDDLFCARTARAYLPYLTDPVPYAGLRDLYFYDLIDGRMGYFPGYLDRMTELGNRLGEPAGCGRLIPAVYLHRLGWELWSPRPWKAARNLKHHPVARRQLGMDHSSFRRIAAVAPPCPLISLQDVRGFAADLKGLGNLWDYRHTNPKPLPHGQTADALRAKLPDDLRTAILGFRGAERVAAVAAVA